MYLPFGFSLTPWVKRLIAANVAVFILTLLIHPLADYLVFVPALVLQRPWTLVTYMFVHGGLWHILFNMVALFFFGPPLEARWGSKEFLKFYFACGLGGAALSFLFSPHAAILGASAAIFGVMVAFAVSWPDSPIYIWGIFPIKAKWLVSGLVLLELASAYFGSHDGIAHFAHLGGVAMAFLYLKLWPPAPVGLWGPGKADKWSAAGPGLADRLRRLTRGTHLRIEHRERDVSGDGRGDELPRRPRRRREERMLDDIDRVLDKISERGMASLTPEEKRLLDEVSRKYRQN